jgi:hypothetical protein
MKNILGFILIIILGCCSDNNRDDKINNNSDEYRDITKNFSIQEFEAIKNFILENGDRQTYCNMYNNNPHYSFEGFEVYLNPEIGQGNINCDPEISDFNEIVIKDQNADPQYYYILIVRQGDLENKEIFFSVPAGMKEEKVYLLKYYEYDLDLMESKIYVYIELINNEININ